MEWDTPYWMAVTPDIESMTPEELAAELAYLEEQRIEMSIVDWEDTEEDDYED
jgi:hypothetical protein